jgi:hypothetical protein
MGSVSRVVRLLLAGAGPQAGSSFAIPVYTGISMLRSLFKKKTLTGLARTCG